MEVEFMTTDTTLPPCMPLPRAMLRLPISSTGKVIEYLSTLEDLPPVDMDSTGLPKRQ